MKDWRILNTFIYAHDAHMAKNYLESQGIDVILKDELTVQVNNFYSNAIGGVKILIRDEDFDLGVETLKQGGYIVPENEQDRTPIERILLSSNLDKSICPFCNQKT